MTSKTQIRGKITYDDFYGHVCSCSENVHYDPDGYPVCADYAATVHVARDIEPTESGSYWYVCERCGAGGWSGC